VLPQQRLLGKQLLQHFFQFLRKKKQIAGVPHANNLEVRGLLVVMTVILTITAIALEIATNTHRGVHVERHRRAAVANQAPHISSNSMMVNSVWMLRIVN